MLSKIKYFIKTPVYLNGGKCKTFIYKVLHPIRVWRFTKENNMSSDNIVRKKMIEKYNKV